MAPPRVDALILGCGYLGRRVAAHWLAAGRRAAALTRRNADKLVSLGIEPVTGNVLDAESLRRLPEAHTVLYAVGLDRTSGKTMREVYVDGLGLVLDTIPTPRRFIHVSSTGVYGQTDGGWVDESSETRPAEESGKTVLEAERLLRSKLPQAMILRFGGIYGPGRLPRKDAVKSGEPLVGDPEKWLNLVHVDDGAAAVVAVEDQGTAGETYNIVDDEPVTRREFYSLLAGLLGAPPARFEFRPEPASPSRRVCNHKARERLRWAPRFPSCREGLLAAE